MKVTKKERKGFYEPTEEYCKHLYGLGEDVAEVSRDIFNLDLIQMVSELKYKPSRRDEMIRDMELYDVHIPIDEVIIKFRNYPFSSFMKLMRGIQKVKPSFNYEP